MPLTEAQLRSKREEFWDTAPAFEGKTEIWAALKAAVDAATKEDQVLRIQNPYIKTVMIPLRHWHRQYLTELESLYLEVRLTLKPSWQTFNTFFCPSLISSRKTFLFPGSLVECYDELGTRYSIPVYCLSLPVNLLVEGAGDR